MLDKIIASPIPLYSGRIVDVKIEYLLLIAPIFAFVILVARTTMGYKTYGVFAPVIVALTLIFSHNPLISLLIYLSTILVGGKSLLLIKKLHMQRISENVIALFVISTYLYAINKYVTENFFQSATLLPMFTSIYLLQNYLKVNDESSTKEANNLLIKTLTLSMLLLVLEAGLYQLYVHKLLVPFFFVTFALSILMGLYKGARVNEYFRFKHVS